MKILIVSDSHGLQRELEELKKRHRDAELFIHCGDSELEKDDPAIQGFHVVRGNCDFHNGFPEQLLLSVKDKKIFVTHGHLYQVKTNPLNVYYKARESGADIACFGHSHRLGAEMADGVLLINPGSVRLPRGRSEKTYVVLEIGEDHYLVRVYEYLGKELEDLRQTFPF
ncbi:metallophosphoesterase [Caldibacillus debilis]|uniref:metallophosphoesterase n=1 Tax=Caldibacillus debilis TaxID=301148 RepID=UPI00038118A8|nr:metallophosphoesterase [Caldibacillus debilis]